MMTDTIPIEEDWGDYFLDLDEKYAHEFFIGKSNDEMKPMYEEDIGSRATDLMFMPRAPFLYYMNGFHDFVKNKTNAVDSYEMALWFMGVIIHKIKDDPEHILPLIYELMPTVQYIAEHPEEYDMDDDDNLRQLHDDLTMIENFIKTEIK